MLQRIDRCVFTAKQTYVTGIVNLYVRSDTKERMSTTVEGSDTSKNRVRDFEII